MTTTTSLLPEDEAGTRWRHNVKDTALQHFQVHYADDAITHDDIHHYVYGVLHAPDFRERYAINLVREAPRVPLADSFWPFANIGAQLMGLHLTPDEVEPYPLQTVHPVDESPYPNPPAVDWLIATKMQRIYHDPNARGPLKGIRINPQLALIGIPVEAHAYKVGIHTPVEHAVRTLTVEADKETGEIIKDANDKFTDAPTAGLRRHLECRVALAVQSAKLIAQLPPAIPSHIPPVL